MFDHDILHQGGKVKCDYDLKGKNDNLWDKNTMSWYVYDEHLNNICKLKKSRSSCESAEYDKDLHLPKNKKKPLIGCEWSDPMISKDKKIKKPGECLYRRHVYDNDKNPICKPMHCSQKSIPNSNRVISPGKHPLPGSLHSHKWGSCVKYIDGNKDKVKKLDHINTAEDCMCFKHTNCKKCTESPGKNCLWCGSGVNGGCYSIHTNHKECKSNNKRQMGTGSCTRKHGIQGLSKIKDNWDGNKLNCEKPKCLTKNNIVVKQSILDKYKKVSELTNNREICLSGNKRWIDKPSINTSLQGSCIYTNENVSDKSLRFVVNPKSTTDISTKHNICIGIKNKDTKLCSEKSIKDCESDSKCTITINDMSILHNMWSENSNPNYHIDKIYGSNYSTSNKCYKCVKGKDIIQKKKIK